MVDDGQLAGKENLSRLEVEMRKVEDGVAEILNDLRYLRRREERMRDTNGTLFAHLSLCHCH